MLLIRGAEFGEISQRVPVPLGMFRPFSSSGVGLKLSGPSSIRIAGLRAAVVICYEQLLPWTLFTALVEGPQGVLAVSNLRAVATEPVERQQRTVVQAWADLFAVPVITAVNK